MKSHIFFHRVIQCLLPRNKRFELEQTDLTNLELFVTHDFIVVLNNKISNLVKILKQADVKKIC